MGRGEDPHRVKVDLHHLAKIRGLSYSLRQLPQAMPQLHVVPVLRLDCVCLGLHRDHCGVS